MNELATDIKKLQEETLKNLKNSTVAALSVKKFTPWFSPAPMAVNCTVSLTPSLPFGSLFRLRLWCWSQYTVFTTSST